MVQQGCARFPLVRTVELLAMSGGCRCQKRLFIKCRVRKDADEVRAAALSRARPDIVEDIFSFNTYEVSPISSAGFHSHLTPPVELNAPEQLSQNSHVAVIQPTRHARAGLGTNSPTRRGCSCMVGFSAFASFKDRKVESLAALSPNDAKPYARSHASDPGGLEF